MLFCTIFNLFVIHENHVLRMSCSCTKN